jgi:hypothetical protein
MKTNSFPAKLSPDSYLMPRPRQLTAVFHCIDQKQAGELM